MEDIERSVEKYSDILYKICFLVLKNREDALDAVQETFIKYITKKPKFKDEEHERFWFIRVSSNTAKNILRFNLKRNHLSLDEIKSIYKEDSEIDLISNILKLKPSDKLLLFLYYYEGYRAREIAKMQNISESAVLKRLERARNRLKELIKE